MQGTCITPHDYKQTHVQSALDLYFRAPLSFIRERDFLSVLGLIFTLPSCQSHEDEMRETFAFILYVRVPYLK